MSGWNQGKESGYSNNGTPSLPPTSAKDTGGKQQQQRRARPITDKFDVYKVPLDQVQRPTAGQAATVPGPALYPGQSNPGTAGYQKTYYYHQSYEYNAPNVGQPNQSVAPCPYPLPQMNPNYYGQAQGGAGQYSGYEHAYGYTGTSCTMWPQTGAPLAEQNSPVNYGRAPYSSPWADPQRAQSPPPPPPPTLNNQQRDQEQTMRKLSKMHADMRDMCRMLTEEIRAVPANVINAQNRRAPQERPSSPAHSNADVERFNQMLQRFNQLVQMVERTVSKRDQSVSETASAAFAKSSSAKSGAFTPGVEKGSDNNSTSGNKPQQVDQNKLAAQMAEIEELYNRARQMGIDMHNQMLTALELPKSSPKGPAANSPKR